jgi:hypothetical protein
MAPEKKDEEKKMEPSITNKMMTRENASHIPKCISGVVFRKHAPHKVSMKDMRRPDMTWTLDQQS